MWSFRIYFLVMLRTTTFNIPSRIRKTADDKVESSLRLSRKENLSGFGWTKTQSIFLKLSVQKNPCVLFLDDRKLVEKCCGWIIFCFGSSVYMDECVVLRNKNKNHTQNLSILLNTNFSLYRAFLFILEWHKIELNALY